MELRWETERKDIRGKLFEESRRAKHGSDQVPEEVECHFEVLGFTLRPVCG